MPPTPRPPRPLQAFEAPVLSLFRGLLVVFVLMAAGLPFVLLAKWSGLIP